LKFLIYFFLLAFRTTIIFAMGSITIPIEKQLPDLCPSKSFCVSAKMPLFNTLDYNFLKYLREKTRIPINRDYGYCSPVAQAMFLSGLKLEAPKVKFDNFLDGLTDQNISAKGPEVIYNVGQETGTDWKNGGTNGFVNLWYARKLNYKVKNYKRKESEDALEHLIAGTKAEKFKNLIKKHKMTFLVNLSQYQGVGHKINSVDCSKNPCEINYTKGFIYLRKGSHTVVINGYEGDYLKIYDPWGRIYNVRIDRQFILFGHRAFLFHMNGSSGYVKEFGMNLGNSDRAIMLDAFYGIGLKD
jgi:hypothetical protein